MKISLFGVSILRGTVYSLTIHYSLLLLTSIPIYATEGSDKSEFSLWLNQTPDEREAFAIEKRNIWKFAYKGDSLKRHYMGYFSKPARA